jgi:hypothetical protein
VDIISVPVNETYALCPDSHPEEVINDVWLGQHFACDYLGKRQGYDLSYKSRSFKFGKDYANKEMTSFYYLVGERCTYGKKGRYWWDSSSYNSWLTTANVPRFEYNGGQIQAWPPMALNKLNGSKLCGKRGGTTFVDAVRPVGKVNGTLSCPQTFRPCDPNGDPEFTYCYPMDSPWDQHCPITSVWFKNENFTDVEFSKNGTSLPMVTFKLGQDTPCLDPVRLSTAN